MSLNFAQLPEPVLMGHLCPSDLGSNILNLFIKWAIMKFNKSVFVI